MDTAWHVAVRNFEYRRLKHNIEVRSGGQPKVAYLYGAERYYDPLLQSGFLLRYSVIVISLAVSPIAVSAYFPGRPVVFNDRDGGSRIPWRGCSPCDSCGHREDWPFTRHAGKRARDTRRKALLGGFVVAQCRYRPDVHARLVCPTSGNGWRPTGRGASRSATSQSLTGSSRIRSTGGPRSRRGDTAGARHEQTHRLILLGAWALARRGSVRELRDLVAAELGRRADRDRALLADVLGG